MRDVEGRDRERRERRVWRRILGLVKRLIRLIDQWILSMGVIFMSEVGGWPVGQIEYKKR